VTALLAWLVAPLWGTLSHVEAAYLALTLGIGLFLRGHFCDARAQARVAQDPVERLAATADVWDVVKEIVIQVCFGLIGVYAAFVPSPPVDPTRVVGSLTVMGLLMAVQVANLVFAGYRRDARQRITAALRHERRPVVGGRRSYDIRPPTDPPSHQRRPRR
jgi:hypothetical protein